MFDKNDIFLKHNKMWNNNLIYIIINFFQVLGTPAEDNWPGISMSEELLNYNFPLYPPEPLVKRAPRLDADGIDLVSKFLLYEARKRISAKDAMHHPYFDSLGPGVHNLLDGKLSYYYY